MIGSLADDARERLRHLVRQEEDVAGDGHQMRVLAGLERAPLLRRKPAVALLGVDDPGRNAGLAGRRRSARPIQRLTTSASR